MSNDFPLAIYKYRKSDGTFILVPFMGVLDENVARSHRYEFRKLFDGLSAIQFSIGYGAVIRLRKRVNEKGLLSKLKNILN
jgi:hypothetical protein